MSASESHEKEATHEVDLSSHEEDVPVTTATPSNDAEDAGTAEDLVEQTEALSVDNSEKAETQPEHKNDASSSSAAASSSSSAAPSSLPEVATDDIADEKSTAVDADADAEAEADEVADLKTSEPSETSAATVTATASQDSVAAPSAITSPTPKPAVSNAISQSPMYKSFRANVPRKAVLVPGNKTWIYYDFGPANMTPLVMIGGTSSSAETFFYQVVGLGSRGYRVISAQYPAYMDVNAWVGGLKAFLASLNINQCHLFGASLGGYLALHFLSQHPHSVLSLALCNAFADTMPFKQSKPWMAMVKYSPEFYLKKYVLDSFPTASEHPEVIDFAVEQLESLKREDLCARLLLNCLQTPLPPIKHFEQSHITIIDSNDDVILPDSMRSRLYDRFPDAKPAWLKKGGDFPFLSAPDEIILHLQIHLRSNGLEPYDASSSSSASSSSASSASSSSASSSSSEDAASSSSAPALESKASDSQTASSSSSSSSAPFFFLKPSQPSNSNPNQQMDESGVPAVHVSPDSVLPPPPQPTVDQIQAQKDAEEQEAREAEERKRDKEQREQREREEREQQRLQEEKDKMLAEKKKQLLSAMLDADDAATPAKSAFDDDDD